MEICAAIAQCQSFLIKRADECDCGNAGARINSPMVSSEPRVKWITLWVVRRSERGDPRTNIHSVRLCSLSK
jgi:hypothetical protein